MKRPLHVYPSSDPGTPLAPRTAQLSQDILAACNPGMKIDLSVFPQVIMTVALGIGKDPDAESPQTWFAHEPDLGGRIRVGSG